MPHTLPRGAWLCNGWFRVSWAWSGHHDQWNDNGKGGHDVTTSHGDGDQEIYGDYSVDDEDQPSNLEDLGDPDVEDELDRGYSPPEKWSAAQGYGNTPYEEAAGESLDQRLAQEEPERDSYAGSDTEDEELDDGE